MSEKDGDAKFREALASLHLSAEKAWQQRRCLPAVRFWQIGFSLASYSSAEQTHLESCPHCQRRAGAVRSLANHAASPVAGQIPLKILLAEMPFKDLGDFPGGKGSSLRLNFPGDPHLRCELLREKAGAACLKLEHGHWPTGTLLRLSTVVGEASSWTWFAPLHSDQGPVAARVDLAEHLLTRLATGHLRVERLDHSDLALADLPILRDAMVSGASDPGTLAAWRHWGQFVLAKGSKVASAVRRNLGQALEQLGKMPGHR